MRKLLIPLLMVLSFIFTNDADAKIINGYTKEITLARQILQNLDKIAVDSLDKVHKIRHRRFIRKTRRKIKSIEELYIKTEVLIASLRLIDPELYRTVDQIKDYQGNFTDVYIQAVTQYSPIYEKHTHFKKARGMTNLAQKESNPHVYTSKHGDHSVSVYVLYTTADLSLRILVHELGHVLYQVPNLARYMQYYGTTYTTKKNIKHKPGHHFTDPSHQMVKATTRRYYAIWKSTSDEDKSLIILLDKKRKSSEESSILE